MAITISGQNNNDKILASDGVLDSISGFNVVGVLTATTFETTAFNANHINVGSSIQLGNAGIITATTLIGNVTGNVNSTSNLLLQISGSEKFRVGNGGQLGIGGANYGTSGQVLTSGGSGSAPTWSTIASDKITEGNTEVEVVDTGSDGHFKVKTEGSERLRVDASGDVLIGTTDDAIYNDSSGEGIVLRGGDCIDINRTSDSMLNLNRLGSDGPIINFRRDGSVKAALGTRNNSFCIDVAGSEKLRVDTSGDVLIGTTDDTVYNNSSGEGVVIRSGDCIDIARNNDNQLFLNRQGGDGYHIAFLRDGSYKSFIATRTNDFCIDVNGSERLRIDSSGNVIIANKLTNNSSYTTHNTNFYGGDVNTGGVRIEVAHSTTTVSGNTASASFPHHLLLSNYSGNGSADNRMCSIGFDIPTTSTHANAVIAYQATAAGTGDLQFHLESGNSISEKLRITSTGIVNAPSQAGFYARMQTTKSSVMGGGASYYTVPFDTDSGSICYDTHNSYNTSNGLYTVPTGGTGYYMLATAICLSNNVYGRGGEFWFIQGSNRYFFDRRFMSNAGSGTITGFYGSSIIYLSAGQSIGVQGFISGGNQNVDVQGASATDQITWFTARKIA